MSEQTTATDSPAIQDGEIVTEHAAPATEAAPELTPGQTTADVVGDGRSLENLSLHPQ